MNIAKKMLLAFVVKGHLFLYNLSMDIFEILDFCGWDIDRAEQMINELLEEVSE